MEDEIPYIINTVRAQKTPEDAFTRCWDPTTGVKMKVKDIENALKDLESRIEATKAPRDHAERMRIIYLHMLNRYKTSTNATANAAEEIGTEFENSRDMEPKKTALREVEDNVASIKLKIRELLKHERCAV